MKAIVAPGDPPRYTSAEGYERSLLAPAGAIRSSSLSAEDHSTATAPELAARRPRPRIILVPPAEVPAEEIAAMNRRWLPVALAAGVPALVAPFAMPVLLGPLGGNLALAVALPCVVFVTAPLMLVGALWYMRRQRLSAWQRGAGAWDRDHPGQRSTCLADPLIANVSRKWYENRMNRPANLHAAIAAVVRTYAEDAEVPKMVCLGKVAVPDVPDVQDAPLVLPDRELDPATGVVAWLVLLPLLFWQAFAWGPNWHVLVWVALCTAFLAIHTFKELLAPRYIRIFSGRVERIRFTLFGQESHRTVCPLGAGSVVVIQQSPARRPPVASAHSLGKTVALPRSALRPATYEEVWRRLMSTHPAPEAPLDSPTGL